MRQAAPVSNSFNHSQIVELVYNYTYTQTYFTSRGSSTTSPKIYANISELYIHQCVCVRRTKKKQKLSTQQKSQLTKCIFSFWERAVKTRPPQKKSRCFGHPKIVYTIQKVESQSTQLTRNIRALRSDPNEERSKITTQPSSTNNPSRMQQMLTIPIFDVTKFVRFCFLRLQL